MSTPSQLPLGAGVFKVLCLWRNHKLPSIKTALVVLYCSITLDVKPPALCQIPVQQIPSHTQRSFNRCTYPQLDIGQNGDYIGSIFLLFTYSFWNYHHNVIENLSIWKCLLYPLIKNCSSLNEALADLGTFLVGLATTKNCCLRTVPFNSLDFCPVGN